MSRRRRRGAGAPLPQERNKEESRVSLLDRMDSWPELKWLVFLALIPLWIGLAFFVPFPFFGWAWEALFYHIPLSMGDFLNSTGVLFQVALALGLSLRGGYYLLDAAPMPGIVRTFLEILMWYAVVLWISSHRVAESWLIWISPMVWAAVIFSVVAWGIYKILPAVSSDIAKATGRKPPERRERTPRDRSAPPNTQHRPIATEGSDGPEGLTEDQL